MTFVNGKIENYLMLLTVLARVHMKFTAHFCATDLDLILKYKLFKNALEGGGYNAESFHLKSVVSLKG